MVVAPVGFLPHRGELSVPQGGGRALHVLQVRFDRHPLLRFAVPDLAVPDLHQHAVKQSVPIHVYLPQRAQRLGEVRVLGLHVKQLKSLPNHVGRAKQAQIVLAERHDQVCVGLDIADRRRHPVLRLQRVVPLPEFWQRHPLGVHHAQLHVAAHTANAEVAHHPQVDPHQVGRVWRPRSLNPDLLKVLVGQAGLRVDRGLPQVELPEFGLVGIGC